MLIRSAEQQLFHLILLLQIRNPRIKPWKGLLRQLEYSVVFGMHGRKKELSSPLLDAGGNICYSETNGKGQMI
jgi:hypothetical protein